MKTVTAVFASTRVDLQGESFTREALQAMTERLKQHYIVLHMHHDPRSVPIGRVVTAHVVPDGDSGEYQLVGEFELWEEGDTPAKLEGDGRTIGLRCTNTIEVSLDDSLLRGWLAEDLRQTLRDRGTISYRAQKHVDLTSTILISAGVFTILQLAAGFLNAAGADIYEAIKVVLKKWTRSEHLDALELVVGVTIGDRIMEVHCFLPEPTPSDIESFFTRGCDSIAGVVSQVVEQEVRAARLFLQWQNGAWALHYWVRDDGVPSRIEPVPVETIVRMGVSVAGVVRLQHITVERRAS